MAEKLTSRATTLHTHFPKKTFLGPSKFQAKPLLLTACFGGSRRALGHYPGRGCTSTGRHQGVPSPWLCVKTCSPHHPQGVVPSMLCCCSTDLENTGHAQPPDRDLSLQNQISLLPGPASNFHWVLQEATCVGH